MNANRIPVSVLVIDNDQLLQSMVKGYLTKVGTTKIVQCRNGREAIAAFSRDQFDLIIMDWKLKEPTSPEMFKLIKTNPDLVKAALILTAGQFTKNDIAIFKKFPGTSSTLKPISEDSLLNIIARTHPGAHPKKVKEREKQKNSFAGRLAAAQAAAKAREAAAKNKQIPAATGSMSSGTEKEEMFHLKGGNNKDAGSGMMQSFGSGGESGMGIYVAKGQGSDGRGLHHDRNNGQDSSNPAYVDHNSKSDLANNDVMINPDAIPTGSDLEQEMLKAEKSVDMNAELREPVPYTEGDLSSVAAKDGNYDFGQPELNPDRHRNGEQEGAQKDDAPYLDEKQENKNAFDGLFDGAKTEKSTNTNLNRKKIVPMFGRGGVLGALADANASEQPKVDGAGDVQAMTGQQSQLETPDLKYEAEQGRSNGVKGIFDEPDQEASSDYVDLKIDPAPATDDLSQAAKLARGGIENESEPAKEQSPQGDLRTELKLQAPSPLRDAQVNSTSSAGDAASKNTVLNSGDLQIETPKAPSLAGDLALQTPASPVTDANPERATLEDHKQTPSTTQGAIPEATMPESAAADAAIRDAASDADPLSNMLDLGVPASGSPDASATTPSSPISRGDRITLGSVLVIEQDESFRVILGNYLTEMGVGTVQGFSSGLDGWKQFCDKPSDMIILDWKASGLSGLAFYNRFCKNNKKSNVPIVVTCGFVKKNDFRVFEDNPCVAFLEKPFQPSMLGKKMNEVIDRVTQYKMLLSSIGDVVQKGISQNKPVLSIMEGILKQYPNPVPALIASGQYLLAKSMVVDAEKVLKLAYSIDKKNITILTELGKCYHRLNRPADALRLLQRAEGLSPENIERLCLLGEAGISLKDPDKAKAYFQKALVIDQNDEKAKAGIEIAGNLQDYISNHSEGQQDVTNKFSSIMNIIGITYVRNKNYDKGISQYRAAMSFTDDPATMARLEFNLGLAYLRSEKLEEAKKYFTQASVSGGAEFTKPAEFLVKVDALIEKNQGKQKSDNNKDVEAIDIHEEELFKAS
jgi:DNA-binding NtrC family response regulator